MNTQGNSSVVTYSVIVGQSVANCAKGNNETTKTTLGGTFELGHSFGVESTTGVSLGMIGPSISTSVTVKSETSEKIIKSQQIEVNIPPGQIVSASLSNPESGTLIEILIQGALVANISYAKIPGNIRIDDRYHDVVLTICAECSDNFYDEQNACVYIY